MFDVNFQQVSVESDVKVKSSIKKGISEANNESVHHRVPHSEMSHKHTRKLVHSLPHPRELEFHANNGEKSEYHDEDLYHAPRTKSKLATVGYSYDSTCSIHPQLGVSQNKPISSMIHRLSLADNKSSKPSGYSSHPQLYVPSVPVYREVATCAKSDSDLNPTMEISLHYDICQSKLRVHLQKVSDLPVELHRGAPMQCDPFVVLHLEPNRQDTFRSQIMKKHAILYLMKPFILEDC